MAQKKSNESQNIQEFNRFLQNNNDLLLQKYRQYFVIDSLDIQSIDSNTIVKFISDIFSFDRYGDKQSDVKDKIQSSLKANFLEFKDNNRNIQNFTSKIVIELLQFCIVNNQMFAVKYEKEHGKQRQNLIVDPTSPRQSKWNKNNESLQNSNVQDDSAIDSHNNKSNITNQFAEDGLKNGRNNSFIENQFDFHQHIKIDFDPVLIKKNSIIVFDYYCKQQMALKPNLSFDRIQEQSSTLTLNKFLLMTRMLNMMNSLITKQLLTNKFRAASGGKKRIDSKNFQTLFSQLQIIDPSLVARSELNSTNIHSHLKTTKKPFDTQDINPRQQIRNRPFNRKLTIHSGKYQQDLRTQLQIKKSSILSDRGQKIKRYQEIVQQAKQRYRSKNSQIITTKKLGIGERRLSSDLEIIRHIKGQKDDDKYLKQYKIHLPPISSRSKNENRVQKHERNSSIIRQLKNRIKRLENTEQESSNLDQTRPYFGSPQRY